MVKLLSREKKKILPEMPYSEMLEILKNVRLPPHFSATIQTYVSEDHSFIIWLDDKVEFDLKRYPKGFTLVLSYKTDDVFNSGRIINLNGFCKVDDCRIDTQFFLSMIHETLVKVYNHEIDEWFTYQGNYYKNPH